MNRAKVASMIIGASYDIERYAGPNNPNVSLSIGPPQAIDEFLGPWSCVANEVNITSDGDVQINIIFKGERDENPTFPSYNEMREFIEGERIVKPGDKVSLMGYRAEVLEVDDDKEIVKVRINKKGKG